MHFALCCDVTDDDALNDLAKVDERKARVVELRHFAGLTIAETAEALSIGHATVEREPVPVEVV